MKELTDRQALELMMMFDYIDNNPKYEELRDRYKNLMLEIAGHVYGHGKAKV